MVCCRTKYFRLNENPQMSWVWVLFFPFFSIPLESILKFVFWFNLSNKPIKNYWFIFVSSDTKSKTMFYPALGLREMCKAAV